MEYDLEILYSISFSELVYYPDENEDIFIEKTEFRNIRDFLEIEIDVIGWINQCYNIIQGERNLEKITLFYSKNRENFILFSNYFDPTDQLDFVHIGIKTTNKNNAALKALGRAFSDVCKYNLSYVEGNSSIRQFYPIDTENLSHRLIEPTLDLSKGKLVRKIYMNDFSSYVEYKCFNWKDFTY
jgi:hypothetical protein